MKKEKPKKILTVCKLHCQVTGFDPTHSGFFMKPQPLQADLANYHVTINKTDFEEITP